MNGYEIVEDTVTVASWNAFGNGGPTATEKTWTAPEGKRWVVGYQQSQGTGGGTVGGWINEDGTEFSASFVGTAYYGGTDPGPSTVAVRLIAIDA